MKNKKNKKIKFKLGNNLMVWVMVIIASYYFVQLIPNSLSNKEVNYNQYRQYLLNGEIHLPHTHIPDKNSFSWGQPKYGLEKAEVLNEIIEFH